MNIIKKTILLLCLIFSISMKVGAQEIGDFILTYGGTVENFGKVYALVDVKKYYKFETNTQLTFTWYENGNEYGKTNLGGYDDNTNVSFELLLYTKNVVTLTLYSGEYDMTFNFVGGNTEKVEVKITKHQHSSSQSSTEATCTTAGRPVQCDLCKAWVWNNDGTFTSATNYDYKPVLGHDFTNQTWTTDEVNGGKYRTCTRCEHKQYTYDVVPGEPALGITLNDGETLTYPQAKSPVYAKDGMMWKVKLGETTACELSLGQVKGIVTQWPHSSSTEHQCADKSWADGCSVDDCTEGRTQRWVNINDNKVETTDITGNLAIESLTLDDAKGYECEAEYTANAVSYGRTMTNQWGTLCLPFEIKSVNYTICKFYELKEVKETEIVLTEVTGNIPAGTPVLVHRISESTDISLNATDAAITTAPAAGSTADGLSLVGRFTASEALPEDSYIISNNKFWLVGDLNEMEGNPSVKVGAFRAYLQADVIQNARMMSLSIGGDTTGIVETLNDLTDGDAEYYDLGGKRQTDLQRGVNIVKRNGKTMKVIIK